MRMQRGKDAETVPSPSLVTRGVVFMRPHLHPLLSSHVDESPLLCVHVCTCGPQGRYDVVCPMTSAWDLHKAWPEADFQVSPIPPLILEACIHRSMSSMCAYIHACDPHSRPLIISHLGVVSVLTADHPFLFASLLLVPLARSRLRCIHFEQA